MILKQSIKYLLFDKALNAFFNQIYANYIPVRCFWFNDEKELCKNTFKLEDLEKCQ